MTTVATIMSELKKKGKEQTRKIYARHGMNPERVYGVSVADLKVIAKTIKGQQDLACELYETGNMDAMYLAGMVADGSRLSKAQLNKWAKSASDLQMIAEYTVPWLAVENAMARELALEWMDSKDAQIAASGWCSYSGLLSIKPDEESRYEGNSGSAFKGDEADRRSAQSRKDDDEQLCNCGGHLR